MPDLRDIEIRAAALLGYTQHSMGKTQARQNFFSLVDGLSTSDSAVEITDHDKPVAVLLSYQHYVALTTKLCVLAKTMEHPRPPNLIGSITINSNLEDASEKISAKFKQSLKKTARNL